VRAGEPMPITGHGSASEYRILVSRGDYRPNATLYAFGPRHPISPFSLPLNPGDQEPTVDIKILHNLYDRASYDLRLNYKGDPDPPLPSAEAVWADQWLRQKGLR
jgi:Protein of unknown function (DUF4058)